MLTISAASLTFILAVTFGYFTHRALHQPWTKSLYRAHKTHHNLLYPPTDFFSETYRNPGKDNTVIIFGLLSIPIVLIPIFLCLLKIISIPLMSLVLFEMLSFGFLNNYLHDAFHITDHWLNRFSFFRKWVSLHIQHHINQNSNFGIFNFTIDKFLGSFNGGDEIK